MSQVREFLSQRLHAALESGISHEQLIIDPGFGFGKTQTQNIQMLRQLGRFCDLGVPVMVGMSRKSMLGKITGAEVNDRLHASVAAALVAVAKGARIVRVHDVKATKEALAVYNAVNG